MKYFDVLSPETDIFGKRFLEASAGTGKTFTIENVVLRLLLESEITIDQILVVTFTRAATRELRLRIRNLLEKHHMEQALLLFDQAQIFTIHGFCQRMLQEFAFEAGISFSMEEWTAAQEKIAFQNFLRKVTDHTAYSPGQVGLLFKRFRHDVEHLSRAVLKERKLDSQWDHFDTIYLAFAKVVKEIGPFPLYAEFLKVKPFYKGMTEDFDDQACFLEQILQQSYVTEGEFDELIRQQPLFLDRLNDLNKKVKAPPFSLHPLLEKAIVEISPLLKTASCQHTTFKRLASQWQSERDQLSLEHERMSPDDILLKTRECLSNPQFIKKVQQRYQAVIVDEFQDTDPVQWEIFKTLFLYADLKAFYLVGDPKQSIYAFRKADIYTYLEAGRSFGKENSAFLDTNYRSVSGLIEMLNRLFCEKPWIDLPKWDQTLSVPPVKAAKSGEGSLHFFVAEKEIGRSKKWPSYDLEELYFFPFIVEQIQKHPEEDSAILVRDRYQGRRIQSFLKRWGLQGSIKRGQSLADSNALPALQEIICAVFDPRLIKKALVGLVIGYEIEDLTESTVYEAILLFSSLKEILKSRGFTAFYAAFLKSNWKGESILEKIVKQEGLILYQDLSALVDLIGGYKDEQEILHILNELKETEIEDRMSGSYSAIQIMTIHASKGLEFSSVFALGVCVRTPIPEEPDAILQELDAEKMRQFYVALTRAKKNVYIPIAIDSSHKPIPLGSASAMDLFIEKTSLDFTLYPHTRLNQYTFNLKKIALEKSPILEPPLPQTLYPKPLYIQSFSGLSSPIPHLISPPLDVLPVGSEAGVIIHKILETALKEPVDILQAIKGTHLEGWEAQTEDLINKVLGLPILDFSRDHMIEEMEFIYPTSKGFVKGFIDLCFEKEGKYYLLDWKTNWLEDYTQEHLQTAMEQGDYFLQAAIYTEALKRYLKIYDTRPFEEIYGGCYYVFVRGPAVYHFYSDTQWNQ